MRRRELVLALAGAMISARALRAQQKAMPVIGYLSGCSAGPSRLQCGRFQPGTKRTGYVEGQNVAIDYRNGRRALRSTARLAADLVDRKVSVIVAIGLPLG